MKPAHYSDPRPKNLLRKTFHNPYSINYIKLNSVSKVGAIW